jgi:hypothetical protein
VEGKLRNLKKNFNPERIFFVQKDVAAKKADSMAARLILSGYAFGV